MLVEHDIKAFSTAMLISNKQQLAVATKQNIYLSKNRLYEKKTVFTSSFNGKK